jgi:hypothetical protein
LPLVVILLLSVVSSASLFSFSLQYPTGENTSLSSKLLIPSLLEKSPRCFDSNYSISDAYQDSYVLSSESVELSCAILDPLLMFGSGNDCDPCECNMRCICSGPNCSPATYYALIIGEFTLCMPPLGAIPCVYH